MMDRGQSREASSRRDSVALALTVLAVATAIVPLLLRERDIGAWTSAIATTLLFAAGVAWTGRFRWVHRIVFGCATLVSWWQVFDVTRR